MGFTDIELHPGYYVVQAICGTTALCLWLGHTILFWSEPWCVKQRQRCSARVPKAHNSGRLHSFLRAVGFVNTTLFVLYWVDPDRHYRVWPSMLASLLPNAINAINLSTVLFIVWNGEVTLSQVVNVPPKRWLRECYVVLSALLFIVNLSTGVVQATSGKRYVIGFTSLWGATVCYLCLFLWVSGLRRLFSLVRKTEQALEARKSPPGSQPPSPPVPQQQLNKQASLPQGHSHPQQPLLQQTATASASAPPLQPQGTQTIALSAVSAAGARLKSHQHSSHGSPHGTPRGSIQAGSSGARGSVVSVGAGGGPSAGSPTAQQQPARQQQPSAAALAAAAAVAQASAMAHLQRFRQFSLWGWLALFAGGTYALYVGQKELRENNDAFNYDPLQFTLPLFSILQTIALVAWLWYTWAYRARMRAAVAPAPNASKDSATTGPASPLASPPDSGGAALQGRALAYQHRGSASQPSPPLPLTHLQQQQGGAASASTPGQGLRHVSMGSPQSLAAPPMFVQVTTPGGSERGVAGAALMLPMAAPASEARPQG